MKSILLTNFNIKNFTGSEMDTITIAKYYLSLGYSVDILTLEKGSPLLDIVDKDICVYTISESSNLKKYYDLVWSHHYPLLDYLLFALKIKGEKIVFVSLSSFLSYECLPEYYKMLSIVGAMSNETRNALLKEGYSDIMLIPNYAFSKSFKHEIKNIKKIKKVAVISNHIPKEILELKNLCDSKKKIDLDIYGANYNEKFVDDELLLQYDAVISIGKTIFFTTALGIPSYCYDHFGGYGFLNYGNIKKAYYYNYSGRGFGKKKTALEIYNDLINYKVNVNDLKKIRQFANETYNFEKNMGKIEKAILESKKVNYDILYEEYKYMFRKCLLFVDEITGKNAHIRFLQESIKAIEKDKERIDKIRKTFIYKLYRKLKKLIKR